MAMGNQTHAQANRVVSRKACNLLSRWFPTDAVDVHQSAATVHVAPLLSTALLTHAVNHTAMPAAIALHYGARGAAFRVVRAGTAAGAAYGVKRRA